MSVVWNNELELAFIDCFRAEPVLCDVNLKDYKIKLKQHDAWMRISTVMEIPKDELKKKKDSLMSSYRSYKGRVKKSIQSGAGADDIYEPTWFAFEAMNAFLGDNLTCKKTMNTETEDNEPTEVIEENVDINEIRSQSMNSQKDSHHLIRRRKTSSELVEAGNVVKEALATFKSTLKTNPSQPVQKEDDCDLYGKLLAKKLRKLSDKNKLQLMHDIDGMYLRYQYNDLGMSPSPPQRPGTSSSTHSEPPLHYGQANQNTYYQNRQVLSAPDPVMSPSPPQRSGISSSTHSEPPLHYGQANQNTYYQNRQVLSAPDPVMSPSPPQRPGTSSSTHSEPPLHYGQANQNTYYQNRQVLSAPDPVMSPSPPQRPGTSSSTHSEPPLHYGQANQNTYYQNRQVLSAPDPVMSPSPPQRPGTSSSTHSEPPLQNRQVLSAPASNIIIRGHQLFRASDYPVHIPENQDANTSNQNLDNIIQAAFDSS